VLSDKQEKDNKARGEEMRSLATRLDQNIQERDTALRLLKCTTQTYTDIPTFNLQCTLIRGVNTNKCEYVNKMTTIRARRMFIS
jgi:hypothetical protein